jgi:hypothetical protein
MGWPRVRSGLLGSVALGGRVTFWEKVEALKVAWEKKKAAKAAYENSPERKAKRAAYRNSPEGKAAQAAYDNLPERKVSNAMKASKNNAKKTGGFPLNGKVPPCPEKCELCGSLPGKKSLNRDHNKFREFDNFRAWLCNRCNTSMGAFGDTLEGIEAAAAFFRRRYEELGWVDT